MAIFSCYVDVERFLGKPVKELVLFLVCLKRRKRFAVITQIARFFQRVDRVSHFYQFKRKQKEEFFSHLSISFTEKRILWQLLENFFLKHSENSSGKPIPQDDLIALRKGRLFEELVYHLGPVKKELVELASMHCQPMVNRKKLKVFCGHRELSGKNLDVAFWGRKYIEGYECKGNVEFFLKLGTKGGERARKVREKVQYLNQLSSTLKRHFPQVNIYLASFAPRIDLERCLELCRSWIKECGDHDLHFRIITVEEFLSYL
jgi:hypothetical protein